MVLLIAYQPDGLTEEHVVELMPSESYDEIINTVCEMLHHHLPPKERILRCWLARQVQRANGSHQWVTMQPQRFMDLTRNGSTEMLELRLQVDCIPTPSSPVDKPALMSFFSIMTILSRSSMLDNTNNPGPLTPAPSPGDPFPHWNHHVNRPPNSDNPTLVLFEKGVAAFLAGQHTESCKHFQQAAYEFHERGDVRREADCLRHLGTSCRHLRDYAIARLHLLHAQAIYESLGASCRPEQLRCIRYLARVEEDSGNNHSALHKYQELLRISEQEGCVIQHTWCLYYLGHLYNRMKHYTEALKVLNDAINTSRTIGNGEIEGFATEESGFTAERQGQSEIAFNYYQQALQLFKTHGEGKWAENENRVKKKMDQLSKGSRSRFR
ncbi:hypothetical protein FRC09_000013 [Ceratobasidium sp. 395]|nr:hypothetical protein FRC09_000013 [Ceratobasidium sp. 395]